MSLYIQRNKYGNLSKALRKTGQLGCEETTASATLLMNGLILLYRSPNILMSSCKFESS